MSEYNINNNIYDLNKKSFDKSPFDLNIPKKKIQTKDYRGDESLFNRSKISNEVLSMSSRSSTISDTSSSSEEKSNKYNRRDRRDISEDEEDEEDEEYEEEDKDMSDDTSEDASEDASEDNDGKYKNYYKDKKLSLKNELNEKRELLYQMDRLESKGYKLPFKFDMQSDVEEMRLEFNKIIREKEIDASIRFQRKMLMAFVTGTEYLNTRYDPLRIKLEGWSEQVHDSVTDYDDIFEELHDKYKSKGKKMSPELRLFISLSGSAFMYHLTSRMFKESSIPNVEAVFKSNPELMKQFQTAATKEYFTGGNTRQQPPQQNEYRQPQQNNSSSSGIFGMVNNLFNNLNSTPAQPRPTHMTQNNIEEYQSQENNYRKNKVNNDVDNIINNVHNKISFEDDQNNIETLSVSDEEITSIIEDVTDTKILNSNNKGKKYNSGNSRTLNL